MIHGLDTGFLVASEVVEHPDHLLARAKLGELIARGDTLAIAPQIVSEFLHIVTDAKRFSTPLQMPVAIGVAEQWWTLAMWFPCFRMILRCASSWPGCDSIFWDGNGCSIRCWQLRIGRRVSLRS